MIYRVTNELYFPPVEQSTREGIVAYGGDLSVERLFLAYRSGIFPWFEEEGPILWWSPPQRMVVFPDTYSPAKSLRQIIRKSVFTVTFNQNFNEVILGCKKIDRPGQDGTWLTDDMVNAYCKLHDLGIAKSVEVWLGDELVGGLYGIDMKHVFCGESMFSKVPNASKTAFVSLIEKLKLENYKLLDCQVYNEHLKSLGAEEIPREEFLRILQTKS